MPTNILRDLSRRPQGAAARVRQHNSDPHVALLVTERASIRIELLQTQTALAIWQRLPLYAAAEIWGNCLHFELPVDVGREHTARLNGRAGEIYYWSEDDRVVVPWGSTPLSRPGEIRLMQRCNVWAIALDDVTRLDGLVGGSRIGIERLRTSPPR
ncbi:MAG: cyclophilin-like fold protein [Hyphomicrobiaceae bacterium]